MKNRIIVVDSSIFMFKAIFSWEKDNSLSPKYLYINSFVATLKRLAITPDDVIIIAIDSPQGSWRKEVDVAYKANRKDLREAHATIDWNYMFSIFHHLLDNLDKCSPFHTVMIDKMEADDIMAYVPKYFRDNEVILVTSDSDVEQLTAHKNVKVFSPKSKRFKDIKNPYDLLAKKIKKETTDNLVAPIISQADYERRNRIVNLINLPKEIEEKIHTHLSELNFDKNYNINLLTYRTKFLEIYNKHVKIEDKKKGRILQKMLK